MGQRRKGDVDFEMVPPEKIEVEVASEQRQFGN